MRVILRRRAWRSLAIATSTLVLVAGCEVHVENEPLTVSAGGAPAKHSAVALTAAGFDEKVRNNKGVALVDFWATWCGPCRKLAPTVEAVALKYEDRAVVGKVDVDKEPGLASEFQITGIPALKIFKNGKVVEDMVGLVSQKRIEAALERHLN